MEKSIISQNQEQRQSLLEKMSEKNPNLVKILNTTIGGYWSDKFLPWPDNTNPYPHYSSNTPNTNY